MKKTEGKSTVDNAKVTSFEDFENFYAVEAVREAKKQTRKWFCAWGITMATLILSNAAWVFLR